MTATIRVRADTLKRLKNLGKELGVKTYEEVIEILLKNATKSRRKQFGTLPNLGTFTRDEIDRLG